MTKRKSDFTLPTLDDLFTTQAERDDAKLERVKNIPLDELHPFKNHPFKVQNNEEMERMIESIRKVGTITPALARPLPDGGYELISGHRRLAACQVLGIETILFRKAENGQAKLGYSLSRCYSSGAEIRNENRPRYAECGNESRPPEKERLSACIP